MVRVVLGKRFLFRLFIMLVCVIVNYLLLLIVVYCLSNCWSWSCLVMCVVCLLVLLVIVKVYFRWWKVVCYFLMKLVICLCCYRLNCCVCCRSVKCVCWVVIVILILMCGLFLLFIVIC